MAAVSERIEKPVNTKDNPRGAVQKTTLYINGVRMQYVDFMFEEYSFPNTSKGRLSIMYRYSIDSLGADLAFQYAHQKQSEIFPLPTIEELMIENKKLRAREKELIDAVEKQRVERDALCEKERVDALTKAAMSC